MKTNVDLNSPSVFSSVVFRPDFNDFKKINATQAWSLFFTGGREGKALGLSPTAGRFYNLSLFIIAIAGGILWTFLLRPF
ncbi:MAG: hypothetical protein IGS39_10575 [Calothrix sp. C42_A2020_038]|nr:hypothetical protein [Calothrix sp. C42_A2020_038]